MTLRTFRNPEAPGPHARHVKIGDTVIRPGETAQVDLPKLTQFRRNGDVWGEIDQQCPQLLEEVNAPKDLVFDLDAAPKPKVTEPRKADVTENAED